MSGVLTIVGLDPSLVSTGWGVLTFQEDGTVSARWGLIRTSSKDDIDRRLRQLHGRMKTVAESVEAPFIAAMEDPFMGRNAQTAIKLGMAQSALSLALTSTLSGVEVHRYPPAKIKKMVAGNGRADKKVVRAMLASQLELSEIPSSLDSSDALAVAYTCYLERRALL